MSLLKIDSVSINASPSSRLRRTERQQILVDDVSCSLEAGEILAVIGPNGAGKSSLLKAIVGDLAYSGEISIRNLSENPKLRARQVAILPQLSLLNFPYRVSEVVGLSRIPHETGMHQDQQIIDSALSAMDIDFLKDRLYTELSGGEKQRVQLARVLAQIWDPDDSPSGMRLLLLDEPTFALDLGHQQQLMHAIKSFADQGVAVIMVLHDINLAASYSDKLLAMLCGQRIAFGTPHDVVTTDTIKRLFNVDASVVRHPDRDIPVVIGV